MVLLGCLLVVPVGKKGRSSSGRKDALGSRVNAVVFCVWSKDNKKSPTDFSVLQISLPRQGYLLRGGKKCSDLVFARINVRARCSVEDVSSCWKSASSTLSPFWRASDSQAGSHPSDCLFPSAARFFREACQALSAADWLYLLFEFSGCFSWVLICCLRDYPPSEFVFQTSSIDESRTTSFLLYVWRHMTKESCFGLPASICYQTSFFFFVTQGRGVNNTCIVVGNNVVQSFSGGVWDGWLGPLLVGNWSLAAPFEVTRSCAISASSGMGHRVSGLN